MQLQETVEGLRAAIAGSGMNRVGFVPTMGALHAGHISLIERARRETDFVVVSIFVNPLQFGANEDFSRYPRDLEKDCKAAEAAGADVVFAPSAEEMYPNGAINTSVHVPELTDVLEGAIRPGHFNGVATVVAKLFSIVGPANAYFGEKDWQQLQVVKRMTADLSLPIEVIPCEIVREPDGLAMSSRNVYLDAQQRQAATVLHKALQQGVNEIVSGNRNPSQISELLLTEMSSNSLVVPDYAVVVDDSLRQPKSIEGNVRLLVAARLGDVRLIDNMGVTV